MHDYPVLDGLLVDEVEQTDKFVNEVIRDFWICCLSREASLLARREVLTGKAKFGILGDGKEVPQVALAKAFKKGDWRSGYYRDQTFMFALGLSTVEDYFAQLYADPENDPFSGGRQMNSHYATALKDENDQWLDHKKSYNISSDISSTGGQMARGFGLAFASKKYREHKTLLEHASFTDNGNEICVCTIGDASTSEGVFWEALNAAAVEKVPLGVAVWDDGYGISVPKSLQTTKQSISEALEGFLIDENGDGIDIYVVKAYDYPRLCEVFEKGIHKIRETHTPALFHVEECTQPQGHSTSGSHERYKSRDRLMWEDEMDGISQMAKWMDDTGIAPMEKLEKIREEAKKYVKECKQRAWKAYYGPIQIARQDLGSFYTKLNSGENVDSRIVELQKELDEMLEPLISEIIQNARRLKFALIGTGGGIVDELDGWINHKMTKADEYYHTHLYSHAESSALKVPVVQPQFSSEAEVVNGFQILNRFFDLKLAGNPQIFAFGEDVGKIGDVNQGFAGLQEKYTDTRVFDTGIREWTIMGQAIGMAMRGMRPIAEIQYLDYLIYGLEPLTDDLATLRYRSNGLQQAPAIIRTRGHRLEGIWHAGSHLGMIVNALRGIYVCVPRDMVQAAGMYNTLLQSTDPGLVIECLNGYRLKEQMPDNLDEFTVPLGLPEVLSEGEDITLVTYGSCVRVAQKGIELLNHAGISIELIDVRTLLPFDLEGIIVRSLEKTNRLIVLDEDVPGGASAFILQKIIEAHGGYWQLDSKPVTITAYEHRPPYGSDGDYFTKPSPEDVFESAYAIMNKVDSEEYPSY